MALTEIQLRNLISFNIPDNIQGLVTPFKVREVMNEIVTKAFDSQLDSLVADNPLSFNPTTKTLSMPRATAGQSGYLHAFDFAVFNTVAGDYVSQQGEYHNPSWLAELSWNKIINTPTTLSGYGITDPIVLTSGNYTDPSWIASLAYSKLTGAPVLGTVSAINTNGNGNTYLAGDGTWKGVSFSTILDKPSTLAGYGIGDAFPLSGGTLSGTAGNGFVGYSAQSAIPNAPTNGFRLFANSSNALSWRGANGFIRTFDGTANTADRSYTLPNSSGTFGLLESPQTWLGVNTFSEQAIFSKNIRLGATTVSSSFNNSLFITGLSNAASSASVTLANFDNSGRWSLGIQGSGNHRFGIYDEINAAYRLLVHGNTGNITIGTTTDSGYRLEVDGTIRAQAGAMIGSTSSINASAILQVDSTTKGVLLSRMTTAQRTDIASPAAGLIVYDTSLNHLCFFNGTAWQRVSHSPA